MFSRFRICAFSCFDMFSPGVFAFSCFRVFGFSRLAGGIRVAEAQISYAQHIATLTNLTAALLWLA